MTDQPTPLPPARIKPKPERQRDVAALRRRNALAAVLALVLVGATVWGLAAAQERSRQPADRYTTVLAERGSVTQRLNATGTVEKINDASVRFPAAGTVTAVPASVGDTVMAGDVLAVMDDASLRTAVLQAQADVDAAVLALKQVRDAADAADTGSTGGTGGTGGLPDGAGLSGLSGSAGAAPSGSLGLPEAPLPTLDLAPLQAAITHADAAAAEAAARLAEADAALAAMQQACAVTPAPTPSASARPWTGTIEPVASPTPTPSAEPTSSASPTPSPEPTPSASATPSPEPTTSATPASASAAPEPAAPAPGMDAGTREESGVSRDTARVDAAACAAAQAQVAAAQGAVSAAQQQVAASNGQGLGLLQAAVASIADWFGQMQEWAAAVLQTAALVASSPSLPASPGGAPADPGSTDAAPAGGGSPAANTDRSSLVAAEVGLAKARRALATAQEDLDRATLRAPIDGVLTELPFTAGGTTSGAERATVTAPGAVRVSLTVPAASFPFVRTGQQAILRGPGGAELRATVEGKNLVPDDAGAYPVTVVTGVDGADAFAAGTSATVEIEVSSATDVVVVPLTAVVRSGSNGTVRVLQGAEPVDVPVTLGSVGDTRIEVTEGVQPGDRLVVADATRPMPNPFVG